MRYRTNEISKICRTKCKKLAQSDQRTLFSDEEMCRKCSTPWIDLNYSLSIAPIKTTKRKAQKIQKQIDNKSNRKSHLAKKLSKKINNTVVRYCRAISNISIDFIDQIQLIDLNSYRQ